jgi:vacuolar-type H+-ATPase subunit D/Vma8
MREAWNYQQERINLLEQRIIDYRVTMTLSYIDKKLSEQEGE